MAIHQTPTLAPALPQPHSKESKNDMSPPNIVFQQQNLPFSFSRQNPETVGSLVVVVGAIAEPSKKKRGRPRKIIADGNTGITGATLENPSKKVRGETSGSKKKQQEPKVLGSAGLGFYNAHNLCEHRGDLDHSKASWKSKTLTR
ncbi:AT-hook motif nuclear-localized protein 10-like isoform X2 [Capsicum annuum]|uniref:AT-hook motif nuclear-localized protein 10-like isoform X2 n=1 Tax=Capsicum annuum TaxID=4072 RepID=UPI001FB0BBBA|nr:AT-hook motif nuclear-localized protein 10-like isoform X2 [Capsicum annuum]